MGIEHDARMTLGLFSCGEPPVWRVSRSMHWSTGRLMAACTLPRSCVGPNLPASLPPQVEVCVLRPPDAGQCLHASQLQRHLCHIPGCSWVKRVAIVTNTKHQECSPTRSGFLACFEQRQSAAPSLHTPVDGTRPGHLSRRECPLG